MFNLLRCAIFILVGYVIPSICGIYPLMGRTISSINSLSEDNVHKKKGEQGDNVMGTTDDTVLERHPLSEKPFSSISEVENTSTLEGTLEESQPVSFLQKGYWKKGGSTLIQYMRTRLGRDTADELSSPLSFLEAMKESGLLPKEGYEGWGSQLLNEISGDGMDSGYTIYKSAVSNRKQFDRLQKILTDYYGSEDKFQDALSELVYFLQIKSHGKGFNGPRDKEMEAMMVDRDNSCCVIRMNLIILILAILSVYEHMQRSNDL